MLSVPLFQIPVTAAQGRKYDRHFLDISETEAQKLISETDLRNWGSKKFRGKGYYFQSHRLSEIFFILESTLLNYAKHGLSILALFKKKTKYLAASGLTFVMQDLLLGHTDFIVAVLRLSCSAACGIVDPD